MHKKLILLSLTLFSVFSSISTYSQTDKFFTAKDKLPNSHVNSVYQDKKGFIWICTENGLSVFNGTDFKTYYNNPEDSTSLGNNHVLQVLEDTRGNFWVGTIRGLQRYHRDSDKFSDFNLSYSYITEFRFIKHIFEDSKGNVWLSTSAPGVVCLKSETLSPTFYMQKNSNICSDNINVIFEDRFGNIWIGSQDKGISVMNLENYTIVNYAHDPDDDRSLSSNKVFSINETTDGTVLVGTLDGGIDAFDYFTRSFQRNYIPAADLVFTMMTDSKKNLWIGTDGKGVKRYDPQTKALTTYQSNLLNLDFTKTKAHGLFEDKQGNIWVALFQKGVLMIPPERKPFNNISFNPFNPEKNIGTDCALSILEDDKSQIWIGTDGDGIYKLNQNREVESHYHQQRMPGASVMSIYQDSKKRIWAGTYLNGVYLYNERRDIFEKVDLKVDGEAVKDVNYIIEDNNGMLWLGTNEKGLCKYNPDTKQINSFVHNPLKSGEQILSNYIHSVCFGKDGLVWIGTGGAGVSCYNPETNTFTDYTKQNGSLNGNDIYAIVEDQFQNIWVGTRDGLNYIDRETDTIISYTPKDGLPNSIVCGIQLASDNNLWISTNGGLSMFNTVTKTFTNFFAQDGIIDDEFRRGASFQSRSGEIFFGSINGVTSFFPFEPQISHQLLGLELTNLYLFNEPVLPGLNKDVILQKNINETDEIKLKHNIKNFSISFVGVEYNNPEKVVYQTQLVGFDDDWKTVPFKDKMVTYTNLNPGKYTFKVKAHLPESNSIERSLTITVIPPFWLTWWAKILYVFLVIGLVYLIYRVIMEKMKRRKEEMDKLNEEQVMQSKLQFFTDISHEIRTPLTLVLTPIQQLIKETTDPKLEKTYRLIYQNGERILRLINQLMEMRKLDRGQVKLQAEMTNVKTFFDSIMSSFEHISKEKNINFIIEAENNLPEIWIDQEKLDKVVFNVLSNAFKYTPAGGEIKIVIDKHEPDLRIKISDTGPGIPKNSQSLIFNRFYQIKGESNKNKMGTGIGLHLSKSLMEIHHGKIYVEESDTTGSTFVILLPLSKDYLKPDEILTEHTERSLATLVQPSLLSDTEFVPEQIDKRRVFKYKVQIVEDDPDIRNYIAEILGEEYEIIQSENGRVGLETAISEQPNCIISDIMMPEIDGIELCKKIKTNENTCHIPVILLTAKTNIEQRVEGLQIGADSYIPKPFNVEHLKVRISKLIELREVLKQKYTGKLDVKEDTIQLKSADEIFLQKVEKVITEQISNPELTVETLGQQIGMSRSQLQRKLKQLTNQNPSDYIKTTRLRHAAHLLSSKKFAIAEIAYATGFSSQAHFSNSFKEAYGMSPTRYMEVASQ